MPESYSFHNVQNHKNTASALSYSNSVVIFCCQASDCLNAFEFSISDPKVITPMITSNLRDLFLFYMHPLFLRLTPATSGFTRGSHISSIHTFQPRQLSCLKDSIRLSLFSTAVYSRPPGWASWLESGCVLESLNVCEGGGDGVCVKWGQFWQRQPLKHTRWGVWRATPTSSVLGTHSSALHDNKQLTFLCLSLTGGSACSTFLLPTETH